MIRGGTFTKPEVSIKRAAVGRVRRLLPCSDFCLQIIVRFQDIVWLGFHQIYYFLISLTIE